MKPSQKTGKRFSKAEAVEILCQCKALKWSIAALEAEANAILRKPDLRVVKISDGRT